MKTGGEFVRVAALAAAFGIVFGSTSMKGQDHTSAVRLAAEECSRALIGRNYEKIVDYMYSPLVEFFGGRETAVKLADRQMQLLLGENLHLDSCSIGMPTPVVMAGDELHTIVPIVLHLSGPSLNMDQETYYVAVSNDGGASWRFVDGDLLDLNTLGMFFTAWNDDLRLPARRSPRVTYIQGQAYVEPVAGE